MTLQNRVKNIPLTNFNAASLTNNYQAINSSGISNQCFLLRIINDSTANITISYDGINDHDHLAGTAASIPRETLEVPLSQNSSSSGLILFAKGTIVYIKGTAGIGTIYLAGYYQSGV